MIEQLPMMPIYVAGTDGFLSLRDAALVLRKVTANPGHALIRRPDQAPKIELYRRESKRFQSATYTRPSLLREVNATTPQASEAVQALIKRRGGQAAIKAEELADRALDALTAFLEASWDPTAKHVMLFSSGYDSRLVGGLVAKIARKRGQKWLGEVRFCSFQPEIKDARRVFDALGLPAETWFPVDPQKPGPDYYAPSLDFRTIGRELSEAERFWGGPLLTQLRLEEAGYLTRNEKFQGVTALFADETCKWNRLKWGDVGWFMACYFFDNPGVLPGYPECEFLFPFVSAGWIRLVTRYYIPVGIDEFKLTMLRRLDPRLADTKTLPNFRFRVNAMRERNLAKLCAMRSHAPATIGVAGHIDQQWISPATAARMEADYARSWYAKTFGPLHLGFDTDRVFRYWDDKNTHYIKAAIYEHLRNEGVEVVK